MPRAKVVCGCGLWFRPRPEDSQAAGELCPVCRMQRRGTATVAFEPPAPTTLINVPGESVHIDRAGKLRRGAPEDSSAPALQRALRQIDQLKTSKVELVRAVMSAARDAASALQIPPVLRSPETVARQLSGLDGPGTPETAVSVLADWQLGKKTPTYNSDIAAQRMAEYYRSMMSIVRIQRQDHPVNHLKVFLLGDLVEGELIFPGQAHRIDASLFRQVVVDGPQILSAFLREALADFDTVHVAGVIGNHGRLSWEHHPESNADGMMYEVTRQILQNEERLTWAPNMTAGERNWYALEEVEGHKFFLFHGDQIKGGFAGFPWYGFGKALLPWKVKFGFDYSLSGHFHNPVNFTVGGTEHWGSGTLESDNTWALEELKAWGRPSQWLLFVHPKKGVSAQYQVRL